MFNPSYVLLLLCLTSLSYQRIILESRRVTNWGDWGPWERCPEGSFVVGMQLKVEEFQKEGDDTALNAIEFFCADLKDTSKFNKYITSSQGEWGTWRAKNYCFGIAVGFELKSEPNQGKGDDTAANDVRLYCNKRRLEGGGTEFGYWTDINSCPDRHGICALRTQVEPWLKGGDDTTLNNLDVECCKVTDPASTCCADMEWKFVTACDNTQGVNPKTCQYSEKVGVSYSSFSSETIETQKEVYNDIGFSVGVAGMGLSANFHATWGEKQIDGFSVTQASEQTWESEKTFTQTFDVLPGYKTVMEQLMGGCGFYSIGIKYFRFKDTNASDYEEPYRYPQYGSFNSNSTSSHNSLVPWGNGTKSNTVCNDRGMNTGSMGTKFVRSLLCLTIFLALGA